MTIDMRNTRMENIAIEVRNPLTATFESAWNSETLMADAIIMKYGTKIISIGTNKPTTVTAMRNFQCLVNSSQAFENI
jgi:hypothetical protein